MLKSKLNYLDLSDQVWSIMKTIQDNNLIDHLSSFNVESDTKLLWPIELGVNCDENQIGQLCDWLYRCDLHWKPNWATVTEQTESCLRQKPELTMTWPIV